METITLTKRGVNIELTTTLLVHVKNQKSQQTDMYNNNSAKSQIKASISIPKQCSWNDNSHKEWKRNVYASAEACVCIYEWIAEHHKHHKEERHELSSSLNSIDPQASKLRWLQKSSGERDEKKNLKNKIYNFQAFLFFSQGEANHDPSIKRTPIVCSISCW